jgi:IclR family KDG regulon transcriptional repressor
MPARRAPNTAIKSAERTLKVFEHFERVQAAAPARDIARVLGAPRSSTAALLGTLVRLGYLTHDRSTRKYLPTFRLAELGAWISRGFPAEDRDRIVPVLHELKAKLNETIVLGIVQDLHAYYVHVELADRPVMYFVRAGAVRPICRSAVGWALLSALPDIEVTRVVERHNASGDDQRVKVADVLAQVQSARKHGYAFSRHAYLQGVGMIAAPVLLDDRKRVYAIGVGGPIERLDEKEDSIVRELRGAVRQVSKARSSG